MDNLRPRPPCRAFDDSICGNGQLAGNCLSKQILDYYYKFGQNRDLERFLKLNRSHSKSSSESSLDNYSHFSRRRRHNMGKTKSMEHLHFCESGKFRREKFVKITTPCETDEPDEEDSSEIVVTAPKSSTRPNKVTVKKDKEGVKKSYQINVESKVEIAFPTQFYQAISSSTQERADLITREFTQKNTQTKSVNTSTEDEKNCELEEEIREVKFTPQIEPKPEEFVSERPSSPTSSIASNKQKLEWDSLADVGYQRSQSEPKSFNTQFMDALSLRETQSATPIKSKSKGAISKKSKSTSDSKSTDKWKELLKIIGKSGQKSSLEQSSVEPSKITFDAENSKFAQSTPFSSPAAQVQKIEEKSCQTQEISTTNQSVQANSEYQDQSTTMSSKRNSTSNQSIGVGTAGSFEYINCKSLEEKSNQNSETSSNNESKSSSDTLQIRRKISEYIGNVTGIKDFESEELHQAVDYIALLFETKSIDRDFKKKMVERIIGKLLKGRILSRSQSSVDNKSLKSINSTSIKSQNSVDKSDKTSTTSSKKSKSSKESHKSTKVAEIHSNEALADYLKPMTKSEINYQKKKSTSSEISGKSSKKSEKASSSSEKSDNKEKDLQLKCIEKEIEYLERIKKLIETGRMNLDDRNKNVQPMKGSLSSGTTTESMVFNTNEETSTHTALSSHITDWNSHKNLQTVMKNRSKLKTPNDEENLTAFVQKRTKEFSEMYEKQKESLTSNKYYSEPVPEVKNRPQKQIPLTYVNASTSINSCEFSLAGTEFNSKTSTLASSASGMVFRNYSELSQKSFKSSTKSSTLKLPLKLNSAETQTTSSLILSAPISKSTATGSTRVQTKCVKKLQQDKILQVRPEPISYTIILNELKKTPISSKTETISSMKIDSERKLKILHEKNLGLENYLKQNRPDFIVQAEERKEVIDFVKKRRDIKNKEKENLLMTENLERNKFDKLLDKSLQEPSMPSSTNLSIIYKKQARSKYHNLPEMVQKREFEKLKAYKRNTQVLADIFKKNLQRKTLRGEINIPHSKRVLKTL